MSSAIERFERRERQRVDLVAEKAWRRSVNIAIVLNPPLTRRVRAFRKFAFQPDYIGKPMDEVVSAFLEAQKEQDEAILQVIEAPAAPVTKRPTMPFSYIGKHQNAIDRKNHSLLEIRFRNIYSKWPSALELQQAMPFLKRRPTYNKDE